ncbi:alpha/beta fold hydrolase [Agromyces larvae]|uniref:Alpha/beta hydrolase n=1 Tax=Agromyces larvae TaxID=2929802 RepID=A0ABY4BXR9_9MICO|nr:alpha/beta fold hydrolase [Agromyces larvae]UOE43968.1 alpha/beta hydrolase [Agromyces larvae]
MTVLLLHGLGSDRRQPLDLLAPVLAASPGRSERVLALDVRAHGAHPEIGAPADFGLDRLADDVARRALPELEGDDSPLTVIGISMGAAIGLRLALDGLLRIRRAVYLRPSFDDRSLPDHLRPFPVIGGMLAEAGPDGAELFRSTELYERVAHASPAGGRALLAQFTAPDAAPRAIRLVEIPRNRAFADDAELAASARAGIRTLVVGAERDPVHPLPIAQRWAAGLDAPLATVPARDAGLPAQTRAIHAVVGRFLAAE